MYLELRKVGKWKEPQIVGIWRILCSGWSTVEEIEVVGNVVVRVIAWKSAELVIDLEWKWVKGSVELWTVSQKWRNQVVRDGVVGS